MVLNVLFLIIGVILLIFLESFLVAMVGFKISFLLFLVLSRKVDWRILVLVGGIVFIISDVVAHLPFGSSLIIVGISFALYLLGALFFSPDVFYVKFFWGLIVFWAYYLLYILLSGFFVDGQFGILDVRGIWISFVKAFLSAVLLVVLEPLLQKVRGGREGSSLKLK